MLYQHLKITKKLKQIVLPILPVLITIIFIVGKFEVPNFLANSMHNLAKPMWALRDSTLTTTSAALKTMQTKQTLINENLILQNNILQLRRENYISQAIIKENETLQKLLDRIDKHTELLPSTIIHNKAYSPYDTFIIDIGASNGVREDMLVITPENIVVGMITKALNDTSTVTQFSAPKITTDIIINSATTTHATITGHGAGTMQMQIPRDIMLNINDTIILPSFSTYLIGSIASIETSPVDAYKTIYVRSPLNIYNLRFVLVDTTSSWNAREHNRNEKTD